MQLTENFKLKEFLYSDFYDDESQQRVVEMYNQSLDVQHNIQKLANQLQILREHLDRPVRINIAYRPLFWELLKGRDGSSQHVLGKAADIVVKGMTPEEVYDAIENLIHCSDMLQGGLSHYRSFTHYDIRKTKARW